MKLYRSIGEQELWNLLSGKSIEGKFPAISIDFGKNKLKDTDNVVCFYRAPFRWKDKRHKFFIVVNIPKKDLVFGTAGYYVSKNVVKTKVWTGRRGEELIVLDEAYKTSYDIKDVKELYICDHFADWAFEEYIVPVCKKQKIELHRGSVDLSSL